MDTSPKTPIGIEMRVRIKTLPPGEDVLIEANSDALYLISKFGYEGQWADFLNLIDSPIAIEIRAVELDD